MSAVSCGMNQVLPPYRNHEGGVSDSPGGRCVAEAPDFAAAPVWPAPGALAGDAAAGAGADGVKIVKSAGSPELSKTFVATVFNTSRIVS